MSSKFWARAVGLWGFYRGLPAVTFQGVFGLLVSGFKLGERGCIRWDQQCREPVYGRRSGWLSLTSSRASGYL